MHTDYPLFRSHLDLAHSYWTRLLVMGDCVVDATCGNGHDTLFLAQLVLDSEKGRVFAYDIQEQAIHSTKERLEAHIHAERLERIELIQACHSSFPQAQKSPIKLVVYNLGYLPSGDKTKTTQHASTLSSITEACEMLEPGGAISITCYPGHEEGAVEEQEILSFCKTLSKQQWNCCYHQWVNANRCPSLIFLQKSF